MRLDDHDLGDLSIAAYTPDIYARARRAHADMESPTGEQVTMPISTPPTPR